MSARARGRCAITVPPEEAPVDVATAVLLAVLLALGSAAAVASETAEGGREALRFRPAGERWGVAFRHRHGGRGDFYMPETMGSGVVVFDYDGDGDHDLFFVDSGDPAPYGGGPSRSLLLRNDLRGAGSGEAAPGGFVDVTATAGIAVTGYGMGATAGDVDGDGDLDLYVTAFGANQLFENLGDGTFRDATAAAGVGDPLWSASAAFGDGDGDGDLDLYVANYVDFSWDDNVVCGKKERGLRSYCHPNVYEELPDRFYRNRGDGTFEDATVEAGFGGARGAGLGVVWLDSDGDGRQDLYVANDMTPNYLFENAGDGTFREMAVLRGTAVSDRGAPEAGMGIAVGDADGNGFEDLVVTHLDRQTNAVYAGTDGSLYLDRRYAWQLAEASLPYVGFGTALEDLDLDGDLDLVVANGHIIHNTAEIFAGSTYEQPNQVFENRDGRFHEVERSGVDAVRASRGLAMGDLDGDGDADLVISNSDAECEIYENVTERAGPGLRLVLRRPTAGERSAVNTAAIGAVVRWGGRSRTIRTASSYLSQNATEALLGWNGDPPSEVEIRWPDGPRWRLPTPPAGRRLQVSRP